MDTKADKIFKGYIMEDSENFVMGVLETYCLIQNIH